MSIDTAILKQQVDILAVIGRDTQLSRVASTNGGEWSGTCPFCGGTDRFRVWPNADSPGFWCRQCKRKGDVIAYLMQRENLAFGDACRELGGPMTTAPHTATKPKPKTGKSQKPARDWQERAWELVGEFERNLWSEVGSNARAVLVDRGLWEETLLVWRIGYCYSPKSGYKNYDGLNVPHGIVIPWLDGGLIWRLNVKRPKRLHPPPYEAVKGSKLGLFGVDLLTGKPDCLVVEGELDALLAWQELGDLADVLTLGSATGKVGDRFLPTLLKYKRFWIATDNDEAGEKAAQDWLNLVGERGKRILPPGGAKDITDSWKAGADLRAWLTGAMGGGGLIPPGTRAHVHTLSSDLTTEVATVDQPPLTPIEAGQQARLEDLPGVLSHYDMD